MQPLGKTLIVVGVVIILIGLAISSGKFNWLGKLPGDIHVQKENMSFSFPIVTCIVISVVGSLVMWLLGRFR